MMGPIFNGLQTQPRPLRLAGAFSFLFQRDRRSRAYIGMARARKVIAARVNELITDLTAGSSRGRQMPASNSRMALASWSG